ncbi:MAG: hypothetical protein IKP26_01210 [Clostridia bacterium]|nr:hypothetical protein [Clostridia bacterium]MBR4657858.1 hypothetical protein [Clostridia bacterium]
MRRALAIIGLVLVTAGFIMIPVSLFCNINFLVPVGLILASFLILLYVRKLPSDLEDKAEETTVPGSPSEETK